MTKKLEITIDGINEETDERKVLSDTLDVPIEEFEEVFSQFFSDGNGKGIIEFLEEGWSKKLFAWVDDCEWDWIVKEVKVIT